MFAYDYTGRHTLRVFGWEFKPALHRELKRLGVTIFDRVMATSLLTEGGEQGARVVGATAVNVRTGEFYVFRAKATVLTTGAAVAPVGVLHGTAGLCRHPRRPQLRRRRLRHGLGRRRAS